ncbi:hypothetical protein Sant_2524 [Sodalis praecaptivus]|uniref:Uncharacterized protein n=1 Tax=Sodalis praecaptivus TaxID=1239307 RepID=W0HUW9_9GAMM|nr:hypothetical protein [Sodalis praecaptivus]AHF77559.1 hypothetical protein Sant_2524 [Sodalis praecaptivus]
MITLEDMQIALAKASADKMEIQAKLRQAAAELVSQYRGSLAVSDERSQVIVTTGMSEAFEFIEMPVSAMKINGFRQLNFYLSTKIINQHIAQFIVSISISLREQDDFISVEIEDSLVPLLVLKEGVDARFAEVVEAIKGEVLRKIEHLA